MTEDGSQILHETVSKVPKYETPLDNHDKCAVYREFLVAIKDLPLPIGLHY